MIKKGRQHYCELCHIYVPYSKVDIQNHETSQRHKQNKEKHLNNLNKQARSKRIEEEKKIEANDPKVPGANLSKRKRPDQGEVNEPGISMKDYEVQSFIHASNPMPEAGAESDDEN
jgi:hypothetical protein